MAIEAGTSAAEPAQARRLLEQDRAWCAYALADSESPYVARTEFRSGDDAVVMVYRGLTPPWLFAHGEPEEVDQLMRAVPPGTYQYGLLATHRARLGERLVSAREVHMWRMVLRPEDFPSGQAGNAERVTPDDLPALLALFDAHPDRPDTFDPAQLDRGIFHAIRRGNQPVSVAGTHVIGPATSVAAIGNVFTHPDHRRHGHGRAVSAAVVEALLGRGIETIVLNAAMANNAALALYRSLGFWPFCGYYEGVGELKS
jgi:GNAT superfamily N-acetyltransferase